MNNDKIQHFVLMALGSFTTGIWANNIEGIVYSMGVWLLIGSLKEVRDMFGHGTPEWGDMIANVLGIFLAHGLLLIKLYA